MKKLTCAILILLLLGTSTAFAGRHHGRKGGRDGYYKHYRPYHYGYNYRCPPRPYPYWEPPPRPRRSYAPFIVFWPFGPLNVCIRPSGGKSWR